jgi:Fe-S-cluster-containing hydrogenase component 2
MPRLIVAAGLIMIGAGSILAATSPIGITIALLAITVGGMIALTASRPGLSNAWIRIDWFLPVLRKEKPGEPGRSPTWTYRLAKRVLPKFLFSDRQTKMRGIGRKLLRRLGITWLSAPIRRIVQAICLLTFLWLFFWTCWPYGAAPTPDQTPSLDWRVVAVDQDAGTLRLQQDPGREAIDGADEPGQTLYCLPADQAATAADIVELIVELNESENQSGVKQSVTVSAPDYDSFEKMITAEGTWRLYTRAPMQWPSHYSKNLSDREWLSADLFLVIDPLVSLSTAVASRSWVWSLTSAGVILIVCVVIPRGFCGYLCPLGTIIELFDWGVSNRVKRFRIADDGWWVHIKYYLLAAIIVCAACGVLISGVFAAIPVVTRAMLFLFDPLQNGAARGWHLVPATNWGHVLSIALFAAVLGIGLLKPRFWCKYVCPSGAVFSIGNLFRLTERKVESSCIHCNKCVEVCPFDAIKPDFTTRVTDCTECQTCAGVCPTHAIKFVERWNFVELKIENEPATNETKIGRLIGYFLFHNVHFICRLSRQLQSKCRSDTNIADH